ncbi:nickel pincer cofactor biosynthesis protein LarC [Pseudobutyrivibrio sp.]|uniref:nickel pincer cofactor biosynthesis protein LarC n=1 Tax=Pseudobutyrivibrio sp. TaxID=2014367 RepID=UPI00386DEB3C
MKTLYIECKMGAAGDMLTAALLELVDDKDAALNELNKMGIPGVTYTASSAEESGINGTHVTVSINGVEEEIEHSHHDEHDHNHEHHHHSHSSLADITHIIEHLSVDDAVKKHGIEIYNSIAEAESAVHGEPVSEIHFHEVGTMDAIADVIAVCYLINKLQVENIIVSPINVGSGTVKCSHGILPVPAPATALLLKGLPTYSGTVESELCTPTGAAILKHFGKEFKSMPIMTTEKIGYGMGKKDFPVANCVRIFLGETIGSTDEIIELNCNIDDMTGEDLGFALDAIYEAGAREAFFTPVQMKKNRPSVLLTVITTAADKDAVIKSIFANTTTIGIREKACKRFILDRKIETIDTPLGPVRVKNSSGYGVQKSKVEFDDLSKIAKEKGLSLTEVRTTIAPFINE